MPLDHRLHQSKIATNNLKFAIIIPPGTFSHQLIILSEMFVISPYEQNTMTVTQQWTICNLPDSVVHLKNCLSSSGHKQVVTHQVSSQCPLLEQNLPVHLVFEVYHDHIHTDPCIHWLDQEWALFQDIETQEQPFINLVSSTAADSSVLCAPQAFTISSLSI